MKSVCPHTPRQADQTDSPDGIYTFEKTHDLRILSISDFIDKSLIAKIEAKQIPRIDLILSCGDIEPEHLGYLRERLECPLYYIKGNHDIRYTSSNPLGCDDIHEKIISFKSLNILGLEGSIWYNGGPNQYTDAAMKRIIFKTKLKFWRKKPIHMVITHAPPRRIHDKEDLCHMGFESYLRLIEKNTPGYFIHGHIHKEFKAFQDRVSIHHQTRVINTCGHIIFEV